MYHTVNMNPGLNIQSNGMGQQSVAMYLMSVFGDFPKIDFSIFADPGKEKPGTYSYLQFLKQEYSHKIPLVECAKGNLFEDLLSGVNSTGGRFVSIPAFTLSKDGQKGIIRRQCTSEYKIKPFNKMVKQIYGLRPKQHFPLTYIWMGITTEEMGRMSIPQKKKFVHVYPFLGKQIDSSGQISKLDWGVKMTRADCVDYIRKKNLNIPPKSACIFCPYMDDAAWIDLRDNDPDQFAVCVNLDKKIRNLTAVGFDAPVYLHSARKPLDQVVFSRNRKQESNECEGLCDV